MAGQGAYMPSVAIAGAPPNFPAPPASIPTAAAVLPRDVVAADAYRKVVKQLKDATGGAMVTMQEEAEVDCNHFKAVAAQSGLGQAALLGVSAQIEAFQAQMTAQVGELQQQMAGLPQLAGQLAALQEQMTTMQATQQQQHRNLLLRVANSQAVLGQTPIEVIGKEQAEGLHPIGAQPPVQPAGSYPPTGTDLRNLSHAHLDNLAAFYNEDFGIGPATAQPGQARTKLLERRRMFALFVGFMQP